MRWIPPSPRRSWSASFEQPPVFLERLVLVLLEAMGYGGVEALSEHLGGPGDEGLDGVIRQDALGLDVVYVQAKRYAPERRIGRPDIQAFVGALNGARADRGIFITTSDFTADARAYVDRVHNRLVLIDGKRLAAEMVNRNVGVQVREVHEVNTSMRTSSANSGRTPSAATRG